MNIDEKFDIKWTYELEDDSIRMVETPASAFQSMDDYENIDYWGAVNFFQGRLVADSLALRPEEQQQIRAIWLEVVNNFDGGRAFAGYKKWFDNWIFYTRNDVCDDESVMLITFCICSIEMKARNVFTLCASPGDMHVVTCAKLKDNEHDFGILRMYSFINTKLHEIANDKPQIRLVYALGKKAPVQMTIPITELFPLCNPGDVSDQWSARSFWDKLRLTERLTLEPDEADQSLKVQLDVIDNVSNKHSRVLEQRCEGNIIVSFWDDLNETDPICQLELTITEESGSVYQNVLASFNHVSIKLVHHLWFSDDKPGEVHHLADFSKDQLLPRLAPITRPEMPSA